MCIRDSWIGDLDLYHCTNCNISQKCRKWLDDLSSTAHRERVGSMESFCLQMVIQDMWIQYNNDTSTGSVSMSLLDGTHTGGVWFSTLGMLVMIGFGSGRTSFVVFVVIGCGCGAVARRPKANTWFCLIPRTIIACYSLDITFGPALLLSRHSTMPDRVVGLKHVNSAGFVWHWFGIFED